MLPPATITEIQRLIDQGDEALDDEEFRKAIALYQEAVALLPEPKFAHDISLLVFVALGEAYVFSGWYEKAQEALKQAQKAPGGIGNPLLYLRLGQAYYEARDFDLAADALTRAYALDGRDIFDGEDDKYLAFLATRIEL